MASKISFDSLTDTEFEEFCFDLLKKVGFKNVDWRKGTGKAASPSDSGRDIEAVQYVQEIIDGRAHTEKWFIECKHHKKGVSPTDIQGVLAWANAERPDVVLIIASGALSNPCKDYIKKYAANNNPPYRISYWEYKDLEALTSGHSPLLGANKHSQAVQTGQSGRDINISINKPDSFDEPSIQRAAMMNIRARLDLDLPQTKVGGTPTDALHISISHEHTESVYIHKASIQPHDALHVHERAITARTSALRGEAYELKFAEESEKWSDLSNKSILSTIEHSSATPYNDGERRLVYATREILLKPGEEAFTFLPLSEPVDRESIKLGKYGIVCLEYTPIPFRKREDIFPVK